LSATGRVLLTGATGHLGAAVAAEIIHRNGPERLRLLIRSPEKLTRLSSLDSRLGGLAACEQIVGDIRDQQTLNTAVDGVEAVIHTCHSHEYWRGTKCLLDVNLDGTHRLARAAARANRIRDFVYIGSYSAHENIASAPSRCDIENRSARAASSAVKAAARKLLDEVAATGDFRVHLVSPSYMQGPYQLEPTYFGALFHYVRFRPVTRYPPHGINLIDVRDVASNVVDCLNIGDGPAGSILASGDNVSFRDLVDLANHAAGHEVATREMPPWLIKRLPRLRFFGDFGKTYFDKPHYVQGPGLAGRRYPLGQTVRDTVAFAARCNRFRGVFDISYSMAKRYL
jgi:nucleoside-diphosphate-sugar epimerase